MNNPKTIAALVIGTGAALGAVAGWEFLIKEMCKRFPTVPKKTIRKCYRIYMVRSALNIYGDMSNFDDDRMDAIFLDIVDEYTKK